MVGFLVLMEATSSAFASFVAYDYAYVPSLLFVPETRSDSSSPPAVVSEISVRRIPGYRLHVRC